MAGTGKYGLQLRGPAKQAPKPIQKPACFQDDDDDEDTVERQLAREAARKKKLKEVEEQHKRALEEDPQAFDYDGVYDEMKAKQARPVKTQERKEARYIPHLIEKAKMREREHELVYERQLAKERAKEEHLHKDKEKFITAAYKQKLKEREELERQQKLQELKDKAEEVTKREDLSDFYRNLTRNVAFGGGEEPTGTGVKRPETSRNEQQSSSKAEPRRSSSSPRQSRPSPVPATQEHQRSPSEGKTARTNDEPKAQVDASSTAQVEAPSTEQVETPTQVEAPSTTQPDEQQKQSEEEARKAKEAAARERFLARKKQRQED